MLVSLDFPAIQAIDEPSRSRVARVGPARGVALDKDELDIRVVAVGVDDARVEQVGDFHEALQQDTVSKYTKNIREEEGNLAS